MRKIIAAILITAVCLGACSCTAATGTDNSTITATDATTAAATSETSKESIETSSAETTAAYCDSGLLKGLKIEKNNFFVTEDEDCEKLLRWVTASAKEKNYDGSVLIATDDGIILYGGPNAKTTTGDPVDPYTVYEIGSVTKTFTAVEIMKLIEQGKLSLNDKLTDFFPKFKNGKNITIANLLNMQSGIPDYVNDSMTFFKLENINDFEKYYSNDGLSDEEFLDYLYKNKLLFEPGTEVSYSNTNYHLLALIIEKIEGISYSEAIKRDIFDPLGMEHSSATAYGDETSIPDEFAGGYHTFQNGSRGAGDIHSCMADLLIFDRALFGGRLVSEDSLKIMMDFKKGEYGCALFPYGEHAYGHSGSVTSYVTQNVVIETESRGKIYFIASTSTVRGPACIDEMLHKAIGALE